jgi:hypothetical protein
MAAGLLPVPLAADVRLVFVQVRHRHQGQRDDGLGQIVELRPGLGCVVAILGQGSDLERALESLCGVCITTLSKRALAGVVQGRAWVLSPPFGVSARRKTAGRGGQEECAAADAQHPASQSDPTERRRRARVEPPEH